MRSLQTSTLFKHLTYFFFHLGIGELLLLVSLTCDGLTGAVQERMKAEHQTKSGHMMQVGDVAFKINRLSLIFFAISGNEQMVHCLPWSSPCFVRRNLGLYRFCPTLSGDYRSAPAFLICKCIRTGNYINNFIV